MNKFRVQPFIETNGSKSIQCKPQLNKGYQHVFFWSGEAAVLYFVIQQPSKLIQRFSDNKNKIVTNGSYYTFCPDRTESSRCSF